MSVPPIPHPPHVPDPNLNAWLRQFYDLWRTWANSVQTGLDAVDDPGTLTTTEGVQGGGDMATDLTVLADVNGLTEIGAVTGSEYVMVYDTDGTHKKVLASTFGLSLGTPAGWLFNDADNSAHLALTWD